MNRSLEAESISCEQRISILSANMDDNYFGFLFPPFCNLCMRDTKEHGTSARLKCKTI